jgi:hypothetical protein
MVAQQWFEGERYVTISLVPSIISVIRKSLLEALDEDNSEYCQSMLTTLMDHFNKNFGRGQINTLYDEHLTTGDRQRHKGFRVVHMLGAYLDPRTKNLSGFGHEDKAKIIQEIKRRALLLSQNNSGLPIGQLGGPHVAPATANKRHDDKYAKMFFDLDNEVQDEDLVSPESHSVLIDREIALYNTLPRLERLLSSEYDDETGVYKFTVADPLEWWKRHQLILPILSKLAKAILCIQATSASCERLFSKCGLTIARDRARLTADNAADLVFLKTSWQFIDDLGQA